LLRITWATFVLLSVPAPSPAFFLFLAPAGPSDPQLKLTAGDRPGPEEKVSADVFSGAKIDRLTPDGSAAVATLEYGVVTRGGPAVFVVHHARFVARPSENPTPGTRPLEITPVASGSQVAFRVTAQGSPRAGVEVAVWVPGEKAARAVKTDDTGTTPGFAKPGEYSVRCTVTETRDGEFEGRKYSQVRHHATLVTAVRP
jgi:hypothetical protein